tara:strand:+ start:161 stop:1708 length:1548 start_codon:yes stop_codon:yes gene_type:complete
MENVINSNEALLQTIATNTANINVNVGDVEINVADMEALQTTTNSLLSTIDGVLDVNVGQLTAIDNVLDNSLVKLGEIDTAIDTIDTVLDASLVKHTNNETLITAMSAKLPASLGQKANANSISTCRSSTAGAYDLSARTTIATASTNTKLLCDSEGHLQVDIVSAPAIADVSGLSTHAKQDTIIGHIDGLETLVGATNTLLTTLDGVQDNALTKLGEIETTNNANQVLITASNALLTTIDADTNDIKGLLTGIDADTNALKIDLAAIEVLITQTNANQGTLDTTTQGVADAVETMDAVLDNCLIKQTNIETLITASNSKLGEIETTNNANQVLLGTIDSDTDAIKTAVQIIDDAIHAEDTAHSSGDKGIPCLFVRQDSHSDLAANGDYMCPTINADGEIRVTSGSGSTTMSVDTLMDNVEIAANGTTNSSVFTKPKDVNNFAILASSASGSGGFTLRKSISVDGSTYIEVPMNQNGDSARNVHITESLAQFKFYRYSITNVELGAVNHTIKVCY